MKYQVKILSSFLSFLPALILVSGIFFGTAVYAAKPQLVVFCSNWNMKCREAKAVCSNTANNLGIKYVEMDIDDSSSPQKALDMEIGVPSSIPYIYVLNSKGNVVYQGLYRGESIQNLEQNIKPRL